MGLATLAVVNLTLAHASDAHLQAPASGRRTTRSWYCPGIVADLRNLLPAWAWPGTRDPQAQAAIQGPSGLLGEGALVASVDSRQPLSVNELEVISR